MTVPPLRPGRTIEGISAVLLPFLADDTPDWRSFQALLERTWAAGLTPAVNMDTGYVNLLGAEARARVLAETRDVGRGRRFVAGAFIEGETGAPAASLPFGRRRDSPAGGTPILFQCSALATATEQTVLEVYRDVAAAGGPSSPSS